MFTEAIGYYRTYAIQCFQSGSPFSLLAQIDDVSVDRQLAERLAAGFTEENLEPAHFMDAVCDAIG